MINPKRLLLSILCILILAFIAFYAWIQTQYVVPILMYHSISAADTKPFSVLAYKGPLRLNIVSPQSFDKQMRFLTQQGYHVISLDDYIQGKSRGERFHKAVVITLDDGYVDNYTNAFPILKKYHLPATIFLITAATGNNPGLLNWQQVKEMEASGISFGSHTRRHAYLPNQTPDQLKDEIAGSKQEIEKALGHRVDYLAYPCGGFSEQIKAITALAGYKAAVATNRGYDRYDIDLYELSRIHVNNWDNDFTFASKVSGYYNLFRDLKSSH